MALPVHVIKCAGPPVSAPTAVGQHWVDTLSGDHYFSNGTASIANWQVSNFASVVRIVQVSVNDTTPGTLTEKITLTEGSNTTNILEAFIANPGADEDYEIRIDPSKITLPIASETVAGIAELATVTEVNTGTDNTRTITPSGLANSQLQSDVNTNTTNNTGTVTIHSDINASDITNLGNLSGVNTGDQIFDDVNPMTTGGDIIYGGAAGTGTRLPNGSNGQVLTSSGGTAAPTWETPASGITDHTLLSNIGVKTHATLDTEVGINNAKVSADGSVTTHSDVTGAGSGIIISAAERTAIGTNTTNNTGSVTIHSDIDGSDITNLGNLSGVNSGDEPPASTTVVGVVELATTAEVDTGTDTTRAVTPASLANIQSDVDANTAKVTNATHTGEVTGSGALTVDKTAITNKSLVTAAAGDNVLIADASDSSNLKKVTTQTIADLASNSIVFGSEFQEVSSENESSTTDTNFVEKLSLTTGSLPAGDYRIGWYYECDASGQDSAVLQVEIDDTTVIHEHYEEMEKPDDYVAVSGFRYETLSGVTDIDLDYRAEASGDTTYVRRARLEIFRVS